MNFVLSTFVCFNDRIKGFVNQPLEREITPLFLQMTAKVCGGVPSPLIEPKMGRERKRPT